MIGVVLRQGRRRLVVVAVLEVTVDAGLGLRRYALAGRVLGLLVARGQLLVIAVSGWWHSVARHVSLGVLTGGCSYDVSGRGLLAAISCGLRAHVRVRSRPARVLLVRLRRVVCYWRVRKGVVRGWVEGRGVVHAVHEVLHFLVGGGLRRVRVGFLGGGLLLGVVGELRGEAGLTYKVDDM